jgi:hypothetical protein
MTPDREALEARLHYPLGEALPVRPGRALTVAPGVKWVRMALPFALDHINLWLLRDTARTAARAGPPWTAASPTTAPKPSGKDL